MESLNPYQPPAAASQPAAGATEEGRPYTQAMVAALRATEPWARLMGVLVLILAVFMVLSGAGITVAAALIESNEAFPAWMGLFYIVLAGVYVPAGIFLNRYASAIARLRERGEVVDIESALEHQKSFWKFTGIVTIVGIGLTILAVIGAMVAAAAAAAAS